MRGLLLWLIMLPSLWLWFNLSLAVFRYGCRIMNNNKNMPCIVESWKTKHMCVKLLLLLVACVLWGERSGTIASYAPGTVLDIQLEGMLIDQFSYIPTRGGYEFGYTLPNGTHRDEVGELLNDRSTPEDIQNADNYGRNARPSRRPGLKNRKLSPKALSSLAG